jgi:uncharacterized protein YqeY
VPAVPSDTTEDSIRARLRVALPVAMKARDKGAVTAIRAALGAIDNAESVDAAFTPEKASGVIAGAGVGVGAGEVARRELSEVDMVALVQAEVEVRRTAAAEYEQLGQADHAAQLGAEADALAVVLGS